MEQAAQVDGATSWQAFRKVIVPLAAPGVFTAAILTFFFAWNEFVLAISLTSTTASRTVPAQMSFFVGPDPFNPPYSQESAAAVIVTVTAASPQGVGFVVAAPCGAPTGSSTLNVVPERATSNTTIVAPGPGGAICVHANVATHLLVDVWGWIIDGFAGLTPWRAFDSRG